MLKHGGKPLLGTWHRPVEMMVGPLCRGRGRNGPGWTEEAAHLVPKAWVRLAEPRHERRWGKYRMAMWVRHLCIQNLLTSVPAGGDNTGVSMPSRNGEIKTRNHTLSYDALAPSNQSRGGIQSKCSPSSASGCYVSPGALKEDPVHHAETRRCGHEHVIGRSDLVNHTSRGAATTLQKRMAASHHVMRLLRRAKSTCLQESFPRWVRTPH